MDVQHLLPESEFFGASFQMNAFTKGDSGWTKCMLKLLTDEWKRKRVGEET